MRDRPRRRFQVHPWLIVAWLVGTGCMTARQSAILPPGWSFGVDATAVVVPPPPFSDYDTSLELQVDGNLGLMAQWANDRPLATAVALRTAVGVYHFEEDLDPYFPVDHWFDTDAKIRALLSTRVDIVRQLSRSARFTQAIGGEIGLSPAFYWVGTYGCPEGVHASFTVRAGVAAPVALTPQLSVSFPVGRTRLSVTAGYLRFLPAIDTADEDGESYVDDVWLFSVGGQTSP